MKYCPYCGVTLHDDMSFCPKCGKPFKGGSEEMAKATAATSLDSDSVESTVTTKETTTSRFTIDSGKKGMTNPLPLVVAAVLLVAIVVGGILFFSHSDKSAPASADVKLTDEITENTAEQEDPWSVEKAAKSVLYLEIYDDADNIIATASGFVCFNSTTVVTNYHVIDGAYIIKAYTSVPPVKQPGKITITPIPYDLSTVLAYDEKNDLAILECDRNIGVDPIPWGDSFAVKQGDEIYTVGYPLGVANTLSDGVVSSRYTLDGVDLFQISAPISEGSSGGVLLDRNGYAIGVTCASYVQGQNLNLAIPITFASRLMNTKTPQPLSNFFIPTY
ncbi:MAG: trypsin-like serine protease [Ruminococcaceae bacterium]|nr:trypsin-like serine protease [Oscillospiraceae bacterium]